MTDSEKCGCGTDKSDCCGAHTKSQSMAIDLDDNVRGTYRPPAWLTGSVATPVGVVRIAATKLSRADTFGSWRARWGFGRMHYRVEPGLYGVGKPTAESPVFVSANYKMSFDRLRSSLDGIDGWILVLDTKGINVWCAAGKGTFGTDELVRRIEITGLNTVVSHRRLIVPQLGATGVSAHLVRERCGFHVFFGPVRASDIAAYLQAGMKATPAMRRVTFTIKERAVLVPVDLMHNLKYAIFVSACLLLLSGLGPSWYSMNRIADFGIANAVMPLMAALIGATLPAILLPWLPGRAFSIKGAVVGILPLMAVYALQAQHQDLFRNWFSTAGWMLFFPAVTSFIAMNFTGSSTYTSLSGVRKEMKIAIPAQISVTVIALGLWVTGLFV